MERRPKNRLIVLYFVHKRHYRRNSWEWHIWYWQNKIFPSWKQNTVFLLLSLCVFLKFLWAYVLPNVLWREWKEYFGNSPSQLCIPPPCVPLVKKRKVLEYEEGTCNTVVASHTSSNLHCNKDDVLGTFFCVFFVCVSCIFYLILVAIFSLLWWKKVC